LALNSDTIREIAAFHPRFGAALAILNKAGFDGGTSKLYLTPIRITSKDIEAYLNPEQASVAFSRNRKKRAERINALIEEGRLAPVIYEISGERVDSITPTLSLRVISGSSLDAPYSSLEIKFFYAEEATMSTGIEEPMRTEWRVY
jgi:hypothetical protein